MLRSRDIATYLLVFLSVLGGRAPSQSIFDRVATTVPPARGLLTSDLNGDPLPDLVMWPATSAGAGVRLMFNIGGAFMSAMVTGLSTSPVDVAFADVNGDGEEDIVLIDGIATTRVWALQRFGVALYASPALLGTVSAPPSDIEAGDVDGDGDIDLLVTTGTTSLTVVLNDGTGMFSTPTSLLTTALPISHVRSADVNRDGQPDLVLGHDSPATIAIHLGAGAGAFLTGFGLNAPVQTGQMTTDLLVADVQGEGSPDVLGTFRTPSLSGTVEMMHAPRPNGSGRVTHPVGLYPVRLLATDIDGDARADLVVAHHEEGAADVRVLHNLGAGWFASPWTVPGVDAVVDLAIADADADGLDDVLVLRTLGRLDVLRNIAPQGGAARGGTGDPFDLAVGVNGPVVRIPNEDEHEVRPGDLVRVEYSSYGGRLVGSPTGVVLDLAPSLGASALPGVWVGPPGFVLLVDPSNELLLPGGIEHTWTVPPGVTDGSVLLQAFALSPETRTGAYAASSAQRLTFTQ